MAAVECGIDTRLLTKCSLETFRQLIHKLLDGVCGRAPAVYTSYSDTWTLEEWWLITDSIRKLCLDYFANGWTIEQLTERLSSLPNDYRQLIVDVVAVRQQDLRLAVIDKVNTVSIASLSDFDWRAKLALSSDKMANVWQPLLNVKLNLETEGESRSVQLELNRDELQKLITAMDAADRALSQLIY